jgi:hypothetical protein
MSTAGRCWWADLHSARRLGLGCMVAGLLMPACLLAQTPGSAAASLNSQKARLAVQAAIRALGGPAWLHLRTLRTTGETAFFYQGQPSGAPTAITETAQLPGMWREDLAPGGKVVRIYSIPANEPPTAWEITYQGKKPLAAEELQSFVRWRQHSLGTILRQWFFDPATLVLDDGRSMDEREPVERVTFLTAANDSATLDLDAESHLPVRLSFRWRDPQFHDVNRDAVEYSNYHAVEGIETAFTVTWSHNGQTVRQRYLRTVQYNRTLPKGIFDPDLAAVKAK